MKGGMKALKISGMIALGIIFVWAFTLATMYLWNWLVPALFAGPVISFWQALGLLALSKILFGGFGKGGGSHHNQWKSRWKSRWQEKWSSMSPEDQEHFKQKMMRLKYKMEDKWCGPQGGYQEKPKENSGVDSGSSNV
ncbi:MAG TPA: hypothetical protein VFU05_20360 [Cyclobacteriaceae bacterium]|nr:hypothetical protein [Cyclobacteriaceae bacterium]